MSKKTEYSKLESIFRKLDNEIARRKEEHSKKEKDKNKSTGETTTNG